MKTKFKLAILLLLTTGFLNAQKSILNAAIGQDTTTLNSTQLQNYHKLLRQNVYETIYFVEAEPLDSTLLDSLGRFKVSLSYLPCKDLFYQVYDSRQDDSDNYSISGKAFELNSNDTVCSSGDFTLIKTGGFYTGHFQDDRHSYELYDLHDGILALCLTNLSLFTKSECVTTGEAPEKPAGVNGTCDDYTSKILIIYTSAALANEPWMPGKVAMCLQDLNEIWNSNSLIDCPMSLVADYEVPALVETGNLKNDLTNFKSDATVQSLRATHHAEVVVFIADNVYGDNFGVSVIGGDFSDAYALVVSATATNGRHTFARSESYFWRLPRRRCNPE